MIFTDIRKHLNSQMAYRIFFYIMGMIVLACGITLNTKTGLGVSPIISVPYSISEIWGFSLGNMTLVVYVIFIAVQCILARKITANFLLQLPLSLVFTRFLDLFEAILPECAPVMAERLLVLFCAICLTGLGVVLTVQMHFIPNPGDGIVFEISKVIKKNMGFSKNFFDLLNLCISCTIGMVFGGHLIGIGIGTVCTMLLTGRAVAFYSKYALASIMKITGQAGSR